MDRNQLMDALAQVLENYQRCGLKRFARRPIPGQWEAALGSLAVLDADEASAAGDGGYQASSSEPGQPTLGGAFVGDRRIAGGMVAASEAAVTRSGTSPVTADSKSPESPLDSGMVHAWSLPVLSSQERERELCTLNDEVRNCRQCTSIVGFRQQTVFGEGPWNPAICFMGEAPGADEDRLGRPFVGKAGQLLTKIIAAMGLQREEVYILNALKCRPPQNRTPVPDEIENCRHFVESQLELLQPQYIVCLGAVAVRSILQSSLSIGRLRGKFHAYRGARVVVTYHPSYLLRNEGAKRMVWEDMKMLMHEMGLPRK